MNERLILWTLRTAKRGAWVLPLLPAIARAQLQGGVDDPNVRWQNVGDLISDGFTLVIMVAGIAFVVLFLVGGVTYLTSAGNEDGTKKAKSLIVDAVIGLVLVVIAWAVGNYILDLLDIQPDFDGDRGGASENIN